MPIICHRTNKKMGVLNSDRFTITSVTNKVIQFSNELLKEQEKPDIKIDIQEFHKFFYLAYCITVHASQGETFKSPYTIYDWERMCKRGKYVALSRGTDKNNIQIHVSKIDKAYFEFKDYMNRRVIEDPNNKMNQMYREFQSSRPPKEVPKEVKNTTSNEIIETEVKESISERIKREKFEKEQQQQEYHREMCDKGLICSCGKIAIRKKNRKSDSNHGRIYYECRNICGEKCEFIKWTDDME